MKNDSLWNCFTNRSQGRKENNRVNSSMIYLIYCRNFCKCHSIPHPIQHNNEKFRKIKDMLKKMRWSHGRPLRALHDCLYVLNLFSHQGEISLHITASSSAWASNLCTWIRVDITAQPKSDWSNKNCKIICKLFGLNERSVIDSDNSICHN
jgi:hypothetical protein